MHGLQQGFDDPWAGTASTVAFAASYDLWNVLTGLAITTAVLVNEIKQACPNFAFIWCMCIQHAMWHTLHYTLHHTTCGYHVFEMNTTLQNLHFSFVRAMALTFNTQAGSAFSRLVDL